MKNRITYTKDSTCTRRTWHGWSIWLDGTWAGSLGAYKGRAGRITEYCACRDERIGGTSERWFAVGTYGSPAKAKAAAKAWVVSVLLDDTAAPSEDTDLICEDCCYNVGSMETDPNSAIGATRVICEECRAAEIEANAEDAEPDYGTYPAEPQCIESANIWVGRVDYAAAELGPVLLTAGQQSLRLTRHETIDLINLLACALSDHDPNRNQ